MKQQPINNQKNIIMGLFKNFKKTDCVSSGKKLRLEALDLAMKCKSDRYDIINIADEIYNYINNGIVNK